jgi:HEPN domain-containing protein
MQLERPTPAVYMAGYAVECMLKALVLASVPERKERESIELFRGGRAHSFEWLLDLYRQCGGPSPPRNLRRSFHRLSGWSTDIRYSPGNEWNREARPFLVAAEEVIDWAEGRIG